jgi:hypothetical protein
MTESRKLINEAYYNNYKIVDNKEDAVQVKIPYFLKRNAGNLEERFLRFWIARSQITKNGGIPDWAVVDFINKISGDPRYKNMIPQKNDILRYLGKTREEALKLSGGSENFIPKTEIPDDAVKVTDNIYINNIQSNLTSRRFDVVHIMLSFNIHLKTEMDVKMIKTALDDYVTKNLDSFVEDKRHNINKLENSQINKNGNQLNYVARLGTGEKYSITVNNKGQKI